MNKNQALRDYLIFGEKYLKYLGGCEHFDKISLKQLQDLIRMDFVDESMTQNMSPSIQEFRQWAEKVVAEYPHLEETLGFFGYVVSVERDDYRLSIEGCFINEAVDNLPHTVVDDFIKRFENADSLRASTKLYCWFD